MINTKKIRELCDAHDKGIVIKDKTGYRVDFNGANWMKDDWSFVEPPPTITEHGRTYDLRPMHEKRKAREWDRFVDSLGNLWTAKHYAIGECSSIKVREVLEGDNGK